MVLSLTTSLNSVALSISFVNLVIPTETEPDQTHETYLVRRPTQQYRVSEEGRDEERFGRERRER